MPSKSMIQQAKEPEKVSILSKIKLSELPEPIRATKTKFSNLNSLYQDIQKQIH